MTTSESLAAPVRAAALRGWLAERATWANLCLGALGLMLVLPFLVRAKAPPIPSFRAEAVAGALGLAAMSVLVPKAGRLALPRVVWLPVAFVALILLQVALGKLVFHEQGLLASLYLLWAAGLILLGGLLRRELGLEKVAGILAWFLFAGALASAIVGLAQYFQSYGVLARFMLISSGQRVWGNLAQPNHLADYLTLGLVSMALLYATGRLRTVYAIGAGLLVVWILGLTGSRASWFYLGALVVLAGGFFAAERSMANRRLLTFVAFALLGLLVIPLLMVWLNLPTLENTSVDRLRATFSREERPRLYQVAWLMFLEAPWLGVGFRQFAISYFAISAELPPPRVLGFNDHAHNLMLHTMAEHGLAGLLVLLAATLPWLARLARQPRTPAMWWLVGLAAVLVIHSLLEYPLWYTFFLGPAALVLGLGEWRTLEWQPAGRVRRVHAALAAMLLMGWLVLWQVVRDYSFLEGFLAYRYRYVHASDEVNRRATQHLLQIRRNSLLAPWVELGLARTIHISPDHLQDKLTVNGRAMSVFPIDDVVYRQAMLLALAGDEQAAKLQWRRALAAFPQQRNIALQVLRRRVEDGLEALRPLLVYADALTA
jgi:O-antigen ligase